MSLDDTELARLDERLEAIDDVLDSNPEQAVELARRLVDDYPQESEPTVALAEALGAQGNFDEAARVLTEHLDRDADDSEARYLLGAIEIERGNAQAAIEQFLEVRRLDIAEDSESEVTWKDVEDIAQAAAQGTIEMLPEPFKERLAEVPVIIEDRPSEALVREGVDPRTFGLFEGRTLGESMNNDVADRPSRIVIYAANLASAFESDTELAAEVTITLLHEMGHFYGLDEEDLDRLGLD